MLPSKVSSHFFPLRGDSTCISSSLQYKENSSFSAFLVWSPQLPVIAALQKLSSLQPEEVEEDEHSTVTEAQS